MPDLADIPTLSALYEKNKPDNIKYAPEFPPNDKLNAKISNVQANIVKLTGIDACLNAANKSLLGGGGIDGAIHDAAGPELLDECEALNGCETGETKITKAYDMPYKHILHTVGPIYRQQPPEDSERLLISCYSTALTLAVENNVKSVALCGVSTGIYGYPLEDATHVALRTVREFLESPDGARMERVVFVHFKQSELDRYEEITPTYFPPESTESVAQGEAPNVTEQPKQEDRENTSPEQSKDTAPESASEVAQAKVAE